MEMRTTFFLLALAGVAPLAGLAGCDTPPIEPDCEDDPGSISGDVLVTEIPGIVRSELTVRGTATHSHGRVIRRVQVAGIAARSDGFNFELWSAAIPIGVLTNLLPPGTGDTAELELEAIAFDGCEQPFPLKTFEVNVDRTPNVHIDRLVMDIAVPHSAGTPERPIKYLPADRSDFATITLTANPGGRGETVTVSATAGSFDGSDAPEKTVTLVGDGTADANALVLFESDANAVVTARSGDLAAAPQLIRVAGAPRLDPMTAALGAGRSITIDVESDLEGQVKRCDLGGAPGFTLSPLADGRVTLTAPATVTAAATATVTCRDHYGQTSAAGNYTAAP